VVAARTAKVSVVTTSVLDDGMGVLLIEVAVAAPRIGVTRVGLVANTREPEPVPSLITPANSVELVVANADNLSVVTTKVFEDGIVVLLIVVTPAIAPASLIVTTLF
jgi:hypothetical protein